MSVSRKAFLLRMNAELWRELETWAQEEFRSVNGQIEFLLRDAVRRRRGERAAAAQPPAEAATPSEPGLAAPPSQPDTDLEMGRHD